MDFSLFIFLGVTMITFGYIAGNSQNFNLWKLLLLGMIVVPFINTVGIGQAQLITVLVAFLVGYFLPYVHMLDGIGDGLSDLINALRYRDAYEDIKRKEEEVEVLRREYEKARREANKAKQDYQQERRRQESEGYRHQSKRKKTQSEQSSSGQSKDDHKGYTGKDGKPDSETLKDKYLRILGLDPNGNYSFKDIKKAYRRQASKYHPDKHSGKSEGFIKEMAERFKEIQKAYEWLGLHAV